MGQQVSVNKSFVPGVAASSALYVSMLSPSATQTKESTAAGPVRGGVCMCVGGERRGKCTEREQKNDDNGRIPFSFVLRIRYDHTHICANNRFPCVLAQPK